MELFVTFDQEVNSNERNVRTDGHFEDLVSTEVENILIYPDISCNNSFPGGVGVVPDGYQIYRV